MRAIVVIVVLALILGLVGWVKFSSPDGEPTIRVNTAKVKQDTKAIVGKTKKFAGEAAKKMDETAEDIDASINLEPVGDE